MWKCAFSSQPFSIWNGSVQTFLVSNEAFAWSKNTTRRIYTFSVTRRLLLKFSRLRYLQHIYNNYIIDYYIKHVHEKNKTICQYNNYEKCTIFQNCSLDYIIHEMLWWMPVNAKEHLLSKKFFYFTNLLMYTCKNLTTYKEDAFGIYLEWEFASKEWSQRWRKWKELLDVNLYPLRGQRCHRNIYTRQIKESKIEIFNFCCFESMNGTKTIDSNWVGKPAALRPSRELRWTSYISFDFRFLWLHFSEGQMTEVLTPDIW